MTDDWKRRTDKNREMKNADKQGAERWSPQRDGASGHPGHQTSEYHTDLTSQTPITGCSQLRQNKNLSDDENVRRRPSTNNNIKHQRNNIQDLSTIYRQETHLLIIVAVKQQSETNDRHLQDGEFEMLKA